MKTDCFETTLTTSQLRQQYSVRPVFTRILVNGCRHLWNLSFLTQPSCIALSTDRLTARQSVSQSRSIVRQERRGKTRRDRVFVRKSACMWAERFSRHIDEYSCVYRLQQQQCLPSMVLCSSVPTQCIALACCSR